MLSQLFKQKTNPNVPAAFTAESNLHGKIAQLEQERFFSRISAFNTRNPRAKFYFAGLGALSILLALEAKWSKSSTQAEIERRKLALSQPVVRISDENGTSFPWNATNVNEWLHRPVQITGRQLHNRAMLLPTHQYGIEGYEYVVPLCTKETADGIAVEGVLLNKGFIPYEFGHVAHRMKIENSFKPETFTAYVSKLEENQEHGIFKGGNEPVNLQRNKWTYADLEDMAKTSSFQNTNFVKVAALESVDLTTPLDEHDMRLRVLDSDYKQDYPYAKTRSGALQTHTMPWEYERKSRSYFGYGLGSLLISALLFVAK